MLRHIIYVGFAFVLGVTIMLLPLAMIVYLGSSISNAHLQRDGAEDTFAPPEAEDSTVSEKAFNLDAVGEHERLAANLISSIPHAALIFALGLTAATAAFLLAKRRL
jgi:hypothetical protein